MTRNGREVVEGKMGRERRGGDAGRRKVEEKGRKKERRRKSKGKR